MGDLNDGFSELMVSQKLWVLSNLRISRIERFLELTGFSNGMVSRLSWVSRIGSHLELNGFSNDEVSLMVSRMCFSKIVSRSCFSNWCQEKFVSRICFTNEVSRKIGFSNFGFSNGFSNWFQE
jgi:hypothetical protein